MRTWLKLQLLNSESHDTTPFPGAWQSNAEASGRRCPSAWPQVPKEGARETRNPSVSPGRRSPPSPLSPGPRWLPLPTWAAASRPPTYRCCSRAAPQAWLDSRRTPGRLLRAPPTPRANSSQTNTPRALPQATAREKPRASFSRENSSISRDFRLPAHFGPRLTRFRVVRLCGLSLRSRDALTLYLHQNLRCLPRTSPVMVITPRSSGGQRDFYLIMVPNCSAVCETFSHTDGIEYP